MTPEHLAEIERAARIIDPEAWAIRDKYPDRPKLRDFCRNRSLAKAEQILSAYREKGDGGKQGLSVSSDTKRQSLMGSAPEAAASLERERRIYVASRASLPARPAMWRGHRADGWPIISTWIDEAEAGATDCLAELWARIEREVTTATALIFYAEPEDFPLKGAYIEVGMAMAAGVPICVVCPGVPLEAPSYRPVGSWVKHPGVRVFATVDEALVAAASDTTDRQPDSRDALPNPTPVTEAAALVEDHIAGLARFAKAVLRDGLWDGSDLDGGDIQALAEKHGLIQCVAFDPALHDDHMGVGVYPGDDWYEEAAWLIELAKAVKP